MKPTQLSKEQIRETIARRVAKEFKPDDVVTLGIGIPTEAANYVAPGLNVIFQSENGLLGMGKTLSADVADPRITNAGGAFVEAKTGACFYDCATAFGMMRGGHIDVTALGALQVDAQGSLASWMIPGKLVPGMGGSMDLIVGAKKLSLRWSTLQKTKSKSCRNARCH
jgi:acetate CoA/acetoacetate CoA-transferase beta subunit